MTRRHRRCAPEESGASIIKKSNSGAIQILTREGLASALEISTRHVDGLIASGAIPVIRVGRCVRFSLEKVLDALEKRQESRIANQ